MIRFFILLGMIGCSGPKIKMANDNHDGPSSPKYLYLQKFYAMRKVLYKQSEICRDYSNSNLVQPIENVPEDKINIYGLKFKDKSKTNFYLESYSPQNFDWPKREELKNLYLSFDQNDAISSEHFQISNEIQDCINEFANLNFLKVALNLMAQNKSGSKTNTLAKNVFKRYFSYLAANEVSLLSVLATDYLITEMIKYKVGKVADLDKFKKDSHAMNILYTQNGQETLKAFREQNYSKIYLLDKKMREAKNAYKNNLLASFKLL